MDHEIEAKRSLDRAAPPLRFLLLLASAATAGMGLWLFWVIAFVLPARDPAHIPMWRAAGVAFLAYSALSVVAVAVGRRRAAVRGLLLAASIAAVCAGLYGVVAMLRIASAGGHFEGYILLMGTLLCGHGLVASAHAWRVGRQSPG